MKTELRARPHSRLPGETVIEVWYGPHFIATVTGADGPGVRVFSKYPMAVTTEPLLTAVQMTLPNFG